MTASIGAFLALSLTLAGLGVLYVANVRYVVGHAGAARGSWTTLLFVAPMRVWKLGERRLPIALGAAAVLYALLLVFTRVAGSW